LISQRVADHAVGLADLIEALLAHDDVIAVVLGSDPEPDDIRAVFLYISVSGLRLFIGPLGLLAFGNLFSIFIHHEAMS